MTPDEISVRQWQELYRAGAFEKDNEQTRELAGWGEVDDPLNNWRMKKLSRLVLAVTHPFTRRREQAVIVHMNYQQYRTARRLVHSCCNYDCGNCLLLDNGEECVCPQSITYSLICKWFRAAVLPLDAGLCAALLHRADRKKCVLCGGYYLPKSNRAKYCPECAVAARRKKEAERQRKRYYDSTHLGLKKP